MTGQLREILNELQSLHKRLDSLEDEVKLLVASLKDFAMGEAELLKLPDPLRKTLLAIRKLDGSATASQVSRITGRARAVESSYLGQLVTLGYLVKTKQGRRTYFNLI